MRFGLFEYIKYSCSEETAMFLETTRKHFTELEPGRSCAIRAAPAADYDWERNPVLLLFRGEAVYLMNVRSHLVRRIGKIPRLDGYKRVLFQSVTEQYWVQNNHSLNVFF